MRIGVTEGIVSGLERKEIDIGIVSLPVVSPNLQVIPLFKEEMLFLISTRLAKRYGKSITLKELSNVPLILYPKDANTRFIIDRMAQSHGISLQVIMELDNTEAIKKLVEAGFGGSILPEKALRKSALFRTLKIQGQHPARDWSGRL